MTQRLAVLGLHHETNTFSSSMAGLNQYRATGLARGEEILSQHAAAKSAVAGYLAEAGADGAEIVPLLYAVVEPRGMVTAEAYDAIVDEMLDLVGGAGALDGVLMAIHGACVAEGHPDADADMVVAVRERVGAHVPIGAVLDMHANVSPRLVEALDVLVAYQTNPHVDARERGIRCRRLLLDMIRTGRRPSLALQQLPLIVKIVQQDTDAEPMASLLAEARKIEMETGCLDLSLIEGFPYADVPHMGMSVTALHVNRDEAERAARRLAEAVWSQREALQGGAVPIDAALEQLAAHRGPKPILVLDVGDNIGAGGSADSTVLLAAALDAGTTDIVTTLWDPLAIAELAECVPGQRVTVKVGGRSAEQEGSPVVLVGTLIGRHRGTYEEPGMAHGGQRFFDGGEMVSIMTDDGVAVVITSERVASVTPVQLQVVGLDPASFRGIIAKGVNAPRAGYSAICSEFIVVDTPGATRNSVESFPYEHRRVPMFPFELNASADQ